MAEQYVRGTRAWWWDSHKREATEEFHLSNNHDDLMEFTVAWYGNIKGLEAAPKIECFHDAFFFLGECIDMLEDVHGEDYTPDEFEELLKVYGWEDVTPTVNPYDKAVKP